MLHGLLGSTVCRQFCLSLAAFLCGRLCDSLCREWYSCVRCRSRLDQLVAVAEVELLNDEDDDDADLLDLARTSDYSQLLSFASEYCHQRKQDDVRHKAVHERSAPGTVRGHGPVDKESAQKARFLPVEIVGSDVDWCTMSFCCMPWNSGLRVFHARRGPSWPCLCSCCCKRSA